MGKQLSFHFIATILFCLQEGCLGELSHSCFFFFFFQAEYGIMVAAVTLQLVPQAYCIIQELEKCVDANKRPICGDLDCPLLTLTNNFHAISPQYILFSVSVVHQCTNTCKFIRASSHQNVERESVIQTTLVFVHDWSNVNFCVNLFCMQQ